MLGVIFASEYQRKVKTRTFVLVTLLVPLLAVGVGVTVALVSSSDSSTDEAEEREIAVLDPTGSILTALQQADRGGYRFVAAAASAETAKQTVLDGGHDGLLAIPADLDAGFHFYSRQRGSLREQRALRDFVLGIVREVRLSQHELSPQLRALLGGRPSFNIVRITDDGEDHGDGAFVIGTVTAMLLMGLVVIYGGNVMQAVMEEKASRMAEIVVSAVRPFDLLLGKILAAAAIGATQVAAWITLSSLLFLAATFAFVTFGTAPDAPSAQLAGPAVQDASETLDNLRTHGLIPSPLPVAIALLLLPFGFLIHASVFASLGALYENAVDAQNTTFVAMIPVLFSASIAPLVGQMPDSTIVAFGSLFPFSAPAILPARMLVTDVPAWQVGAGVVLCIAGSLAMVWLAGRVLRGSLLSYGKTPKLSDLRHILFSD